MQTIARELTAHVSRQALELEQLASSIEQGVVDPDLLAPALQLLQLAAAHVLAVQPPRSTS